MMKNLLPCCLKGTLPLIIVCLFSLNTTAQNVSINNDGSSPDNSAMLDVKSSNKGLLIPRMTTAERLAISTPAFGLLVFDTNTASFWYCAGSFWRNLTEGWSLDGNAGTNTTHFIGTTDLSPLQFRVNNVQSGLLEATNGSTAYGFSGLPLTTTGVYNTAIGAFSMSNNTSGEHNTASGYGTLYYNTTGNNNTASGHQSLHNNTSGSYNIATGHYALGLNTEGNRNVANGNESLFLNTTGNNNTAVGYQSLYNNTTANENSAFGYLAMYNNTTGVSNIALGVGTLYLNTIGSSNVATGYGAMRGNTSGNYNAAYGAYALFNNSTGEVNTAVGQGALINSNTGSANTAVGHDALKVNVSGSYNTALGAQANVAADNLTNATAIGSGAIVDASNKVRIGNGAVTVIEGQVPFTTPSDGRFKFNVQEDVKGLDFIMRLRPVTYQFDVKRFDGLANTQDLRDSAYSEAAQIRRTGFIAQEVEKAATAAGYSFSGIIQPKSPNDHYGLSYESFVMPLVKAMQEQQEQIDLLKKENEELRKMMKELMKR